VNRTMLLLTLLLMLLLATFLVKINSH